MTGTNSRLTAAVEAYFADLGKVRASGGSTGERSSYGPLGNLLNAVGATLKPKVFCVGELANLGAGHPDFGLYAAKQVQKGRPREGQVPERGVVEVKAVGDDAWLTAEGKQVSRYWGRYRLVLVTNTRDFVLVGEDAAGRTAKLETFRLAKSADDFQRGLEKPRSFAREVGAGLGEYLSRRAVAPGGAGRAEGSGLAARLLCPRWTGAGRGGGRCAFIDGGAFGAGRSPGRPLRGRQGRALSSTRPWCRRCSTASSPPGCCGRGNCRRRRDGSTGMRPYGICVRRCCGRCSSSFPIPDA